jgi:methylmalonyl-CoA decarboxylase
MSYTTSEVSAFVGTITLDHERRRNALSQPLVEEVITALHVFRDARVRVVILRAKSGAKVFSAGHDIDELPESRRDPLGWDDPLRQLVREIENFPGPVIAMVEGGVWGGATETVFACDLIIAADTATFAVTPAKLGVPYNVGGMLTLLNTTGLRMDVGILRCVDRCWPRTRQTRLSDRPSSACTCST